MNVSKHIGDTDLEKKYHVDTFVDFVFLLYNDFSVEPNPNTLNPNVHSLFNYCVVY